MSNPLNFGRRDFLKLLGAAGAVGTNGNAFAAGRAHLSIVINLTGSMAASGPIGRAVDQLKKQLETKGAAVEISGLDRGDDSFYIFISDRALHATAAESYTIARDPGQAIRVSASDVRGLVYGVLELAERVQYSTDASLGLHFTEPYSEKTPNPVRSIARAFCSEIEDKSWFYNKDFWRGYLDAVIASRFNRFNFALGFGYDFPKNVTGDYFQFPYPYLVDVPGYNVRVEPLAAGERERNMETLRFIATETAARGLDFQLGIWTHAYQWTDSPHADHTIIGLTPETHAAYCRDALAIILKQCPEITGLTLRVHGESGIPEGSYPFWKTLFAAISGAGRKIEIDMHAKGINQIMLDMAADTGAPVKVGAKYSAEHMSIGYHQADIRAQEYPRPTSAADAANFSVSGGARLFTRYGYADLYAEPRKYDVLYRLWPGTQRHLLWGDTETAAAYGRTANFCGAAGLELCEPLTFKGREGSGSPGGRNCYLDDSLNLAASDWKKFEYSYRVWGRALYNPETPREVLQRHLRLDFGSDAKSVGDALAQAGRILPLVTTAHLPSASNHSYWPEIYENMPIVDGSEPSPYGDTPTPKVFATVSPLDPQLFSTIEQYVQELLDAKSSGKYSPAEVAQWLEDLSTAASRELVAATHRDTPAFRRMQEDVLIQIGLGRFFAAKIRSALFYAVFEKTGSAAASQRAVAQYQEARNAWVKMAERAKTVYKTDIAYGSVPGRRGHWIDRIPAIDKDLAAMREKVQQTSANTSPDAEKLLGILEAKPRRPITGCAHKAPSAFKPGAPLALALRVDGTVTTPSDIQLFYRHVNHAERWQSVPMQRSGQSFSAAIPAAYTDSPYPLQYYFRLAHADAAWLYPALNSTLSNQPYYAISKRAD